MGETATDYNAMILAAVRRMPSGGGYDARKPGAMALRGSITLTDGTALPQLELRPETAQPSFCSGATYHVFLDVVQQCIAAGRLTLTREQLNALPVRAQPDGTGVWGRWNANGPGTARLFHELRLGRNFSAWKEARPGDFMKIWWTREIGGKESGHSVVYLGTRVVRPEGGGEPVRMVRFWSSNLKMGYGEKEVEFYKVQRVLFSRLENVEALQSVLDLPKTDKYLAGLLTTRTTEAEVYRLTGVKDPPSVAPKMPAHLDAAPDVRNAQKVEKPAAPGGKEKSRKPSLPEQAR
ncbi:hypothetical protein DB346_12175 [Verrucomicrobia bacterium LW23]|nr:hypothetical protein DB346_12175 [Verrucomicrobia bacterium LW23]